jgi:hypothetical protein
MAGNSRRNSLASLTFGQVDSAASKRAEVRSAAAATCYYRCYGRDRDSAISPAVLLPWPTPLIMLLWKSFYDNGFLLYPPFDPKGRRKNVTDCICAKVETILCLCISRKLRKENFKDNNTKQKKLCERWKELENQVKLPDPKTKHLCCVSCVVCPLPCTCVGQEATTTTTHHTSATQLFLTKSRICVD